MIASRRTPVSALVLATVLLPPCVVRAQVGASASPNPMASLDKNTLKGFVEQPLFEPTRHPPVVAAPVVVEVPPPPPVVEPPPSLRLMGVVEGDGALVAIVHRADTGRTEALHAGDRIGGWRVEVAPTSLRVISDDRAFDYALFRAGPLQGPTAVVPPPAPAPALAARDAGPLGGMR